MKGSLLELTGSPHHSAQVLSPNGGEKYSLNKPLPIEWQAEHGPASLYLIPKKENSKAQVISKKAKGHRMEWKIPKAVPKGEYAIGLKSGTKLDESDSYFTLEHDKEEGNKGKSYGAPRKVHRDGDHKNQR